VAQTSSRAGQTPSEKHRLSWRTPAFELAQSSSVLSLLAGKIVVAKNVASAGLVGFVFVQRNPALLSTFQ
jgi:hypothetical protein